MTSLCLEKLEDTSALHLQAILNSEITKKKYNNTKNVALNRPWKEHLFIVWELKQKRQSVTLFELSWECTCQVTQIFCCSVHVQNDLQNATCIDLGVTGKF